MTIADKDVEQRLRELIAAKYPTHVVHGEEGENTGRSSEYCWVIDPIDGTKAFIAGFPTFTTLIGLLHQGKPVVGVVDQPILRERWSAITPDVGIKPGTEEIAYNQLLIATTSMDYYTQAQRIALASFRTDGFNILYTGDAYAYMMVVEGRLDAVFDVCLKPYDILPLLPILYAHGMYVQFFSEESISNEPTGNVIVARSAAVGKKLLSKLLST